MPTKPATREITKLEAAAFAKAFVATRRQAKAEGLSEAEARRRARAVAVRRAGWRIRQ